eukprot:GAHX01000705.1.p1 GENE.GAHX01000705.1~~GAHX01000705.1.p1  ORF type:complete len:371 (-),score=55.38 GAHX01000705.1:70-1182(-)
MFTYKNHFQKTPTRTLSYLLTPFVTFCMFTLQMSSNKRFEAKSNEAESRTTITLQLKDKTDSYEADIDSNEDLLVPTQHISEPVTQQIIQSKNKLINLEIEYLKQGKAIDGQSFEITNYEYSCFIEYLKPKTNPNNNGNLGYFPIFKDLKKRSLILRFFIYYVQRIYAPLLMQLQEILFGRVHRLDTEFKLVYELKSKLEQQMINRRYTIQHCSPAIENSNLDICLDYNKYTFEEYNTINDRINASISKCSELLGGDEMEKIYKRMKIIAHTDVDILFTNENRTERIIQTIFSRGYLKIYNEQHHIVLSIELLKEDETNYWELIFELFSNEQSNWKVLRSMKERSTKYIDLFEQYNKINYIPEILDKDVI